MNFIKTGVKKDLRRLRKGASSIDFLILSYIPVSIIWFDDLLEKKFLR